MGPELLYPSFVKSEVGESEVSEVTCTSKIFEEELLNPVGTNRLRDSALLPRSLSNHQTISMFQR